MSRSSLSTAILIEKIPGIEKKLEQLDKFSSTTNLFEEMEKSIDNLNYKMETDLNDLKNEIKRLREQITKTVNANVNLVKKNDELRKDLNLLEDRVTDMTNDLTLMKTSAESNEDSE